MDDLIREFLCETGENLATLDNELVRLESEADDPALLSSIFRLMHSIKGTCGFLGLPRLEKLAHSGENVLGKFRDGELPVNPDAVTLILKSIDRIRMLLNALEESGAEPEGNDEELIAEINTMAGGAAPPPPSDDDEPLMAVVPLGAALGLETDPPAEETPEEIPAGTPEETHETPPPAADAAAAEKPAASGGETRETAATAATIRVHVDIIENLMNLVSELVLTRNQLLQMQRSQSGNEFKVPLQRLTHITGDLQDGITRMRMQPIGNAWNKLPRIVRDLSRETGKRIQLVTKGTDTELDRQVLEMIKDPLTHMVRNSADHGIEDPAARIKAGKPETGTITLAAYHESGHIFIRIDDDGRGLDTDRIRQKAVAAGLATEQELSSMSEARILQFICRPGFSTAEKVTNVSGRGVGMDVVYTNIARIGGSLDMSTQKGRGTSFVIKIPLTLAIVSALIVRVCGQRFAIPQLNVLELVSLSQRNGLKIETIKQAQVLRLRDQLLPLVSLRTLLGLESGDADAQGQFVVVAQVGKCSFGIIVDRVFDTEEIVVKPVAPILRGTPFYAGNTILGDGSVIMILDPNGLAAAAGQNKLDDVDRVAVGTHDSHEVSEQVSFLLFRARGAEIKAVPLELVARIEEIASATIEQISERFVTQYRGHLMPLVPFDPEWSWKDEAKQSVLVFSDNGHDMGLMVHRVVDIVSGRIKVDLADARAGLIGSAIIGGKATDIVDISPYLTRAFGNWFEAPRHSVSRKSALVVDDSPFFRNLITPLLTAAGWRVTTAGSGLEALDLCQDDRSFDLLISDIDMPGMDGLELARALRTDRRWQRTPMIALSSFDRDEDKAAGREAGFNDYLGKADHTQLPAHLIATVERLMPKESVHAPPLKAAS
jgi:two-component system, chemotaxis family, sensor kinase CheA